MDVLIGYHRFLVEAWLLVMGLNLILPYALRANPPRRIFVTRIGYFAFWAFWAMAAFSGLMVWLFAGRHHTLPVDLMMGLALVLPILDGYRAVRLKKLWLAGEAGIGFSMAVVAVEIALTVSVTILAFSR
jgi:hypothetical protein